MNTNQQMRELYEYGFTIEEVGLMFGLTYSPTRARLIKAGTTIRSVSAHLPKGIRPGDTHCKNGHELPNPPKWNQNGYYCQPCRTKKQADWRAGVHRN